MSDNHVIIRKCTVSEIENAPNFKELLNEVIEDAALDCLPNPILDINHYRDAESSGTCSFIGSFIGNELMGVVNVVSSLSPHYGILIGIIDFIFVSKKYRKTTLVGIRLISAAESHAKKIGLPILLATAAIGSALMVVLSGCGYEESHKIFLRKL